MNIFRNLTVESPSDRHRKYLKERGITEEEFQKREERKRKWEALQEKYGAPLGCICAIILICGGFTLMYYLGNLINSSEILKTIILVAGGIWILGLFLFYVVSPTFLVIIAFIEKLKWNKFTKIVVSIILTLFVVFVIGLLLHNL